ncbi:hypothetical protein XENOCAPTIV_026423 [Xenoophorus captivus]|uniref:Uncharacterized protein n=1 Tax=Xenoophorus captivus TaxID=1517983 RepID=A0ABV0QK47_9TELE
MLFSSSGDSLQSFSDAGLQPATSHQPLSENKSPNVSQSVSSHLSADFKFLKLLEVTASIKYTNSPVYTHTHTHTLQPLGVSGWSGSPCSRSEGELVDLPVRRAEMFLLKLDQ